MSQSELEEGFYTANLRDEKLLCYVCRTRRGATVAKFSDGRELPVSDRPMTGPYILTPNLKPTNPDEHLGRALDTLKFIYMNQGRLEAKTE